jgi:hypothetical protein
VIATSFSGGFCLKKNHGISTYYIKYAQICDELMALWSSGMILASGVECERTRVQVAVRPVFFSFSIQLMYA